MKVYIVRTILNFSVELTEPNTFFLLEDGRTIRACVREAESVRHTVEFLVRYRKDRPGFHIRPIDSELSSWVMESAVLHGDLARMEIQLANVPVHISKAFLEL